MNDTSKKICRCCRSLEDEDISKDWQVGVFCVPCFEAIDRGKCVCDSSEDGGGLFGIVERTLLAIHQNRHKDARREAANAYRMLGGDDYDLLDPNHNPLFDPKQKDNA